jgi:hypothetical protein
VGLADFDALAKEVDEKQLDAVLDMSNLMLQSENWGPCIKNFIKLTPKELLKVAGMQKVKRFQWMTTNIIPVYLEGTIEAVMVLLYLDQADDDNVDDGKVNDVKTVSDAQAAMALAKQYVELKANDQKALTANLYLGDVSSGGSLWTPNLVQAENIGAVFMSLDYGLGLHPKDEVPYPVTQLEKVIKNIKFASSAPRIAVVVFHFHEYGDAVRAVMKPLALGGVVQHLVSPFSLYVCE